MTVENKFSMEHETTQEEAERKETAVIKYLKVCAQGSKCRQEIRGDHNHTSTIIVRHRTIEFARSLI